MSESRPLGEKVQVLNGFAFPSSAFTTEEGLPLVRIRDIASGTTEVNFRGKFDPAYLLKNGDVLIGMDGDFLVSRWTGDDALLNQRVCKVTSKSTEIDQAFLFWFLQPHIDEIHRKTPQTTVRHLSTKDVNAIPAPDFSGCHQSKIAEVLDALDAAIRGAEAVVAKLRAMKQGLLHDLLTRGIDANGDLRPPQPEAPHLYHQTPLGWLPKEWDVVPLGTLNLELAQGWSPDCPAEAALAHEWGVLKTTAVVWSGYQDHENKRLPEGMKPRPHLQVEVGDILITRAGPSSRVPALSDALFIIARRAAREET